MQTNKAGLFLLISLISVSGCKSTASVCPALESPEPTPAALMQPPSDLTPLLNGIISVSPAASSGNTPK